MNAMQMRIAVTALWVFSALAAFVPVAEAANRFALACIENKTDIPLTYRFRWGNQGEWSTRTLMPNARRAHSWRFDRPNVRDNPWLYVKFDSDLSSRMINQDYRLESYTAPQENDCTAYGKEYVFQYDGTRRKYIDLKLIR